MDILAKKLINDHRNPIVKVDLPGSKLFLKSSTSEEIELIKKHQTSLENILNHERAERRCARSQAIWSSEDKLAKVTKVVKTLNHFGYQDKNGTYLYPEETLFLMETNRLEVLFNEAPLSIQEGYNFLLKSPECDILKYRVYKKLALFGYRLLRYSELLRRSSIPAKKHGININHSMCNELKGSESIKKRTFEQNDEFESKKKLRAETKREDYNTDLESLPSGSSPTNSKQLQLEHIKGIFEKLRETAPKEYNTKLSDDIIPHYCVFLPNNKSRCDHDFNLYICKDSILKRHNNESTPSIFAICSEGNISFYRFSGVKIPYL